MSEGQRRLLELAAANVRSAIEIFLAVSSVQEAAAEQPQVLKYAFDDVGVVSAFADEDSQPSPEPTIEDLAHLQDERVARADRISDERVPHGPGGVRTIRETRGRPRLGGPPG